MNQKEAVFAAVVAVIGQNPNGKVELSDRQLDDVHSILVHGFTKGQIDYKGGPPSHEKAKKYVPGLVNNWLRKDERLNGGGKYVTQKPGSRTGAGDETLKAMKGLLAITTDPNQAELIKAEIAKRTEELRPKVEVDFSKLPEALRHLAPAEGKVVVAVPPMVRRASSN